MTWYPLPEHANQREKNAESRDEAALEAARRADADQLTHEQTAVPSVRRASAAAVGRARRECAVDSDTPCRARRGSSSSSVVLDRARRCSCARRRLRDRRALHCCDSPCRRRLLRCPCRRAAPSRPARPLRSASRWWSSCRHRRRPARSHRRSLSQRFAARRPLRSSSGRAGNPRPVASCARHLAKSPRLMSASAAGSRRA